MRRATAMLGAAALAAAWLGPLPSLAPQTFWAHMTMHVLVIACAAPLLAVAVAGSRFDPVRRWPWAFAPLPASAVEMALVWAWHAPQLHHAARTVPAMLALEQACFFGAGLLLWLSACGGDAAQRRARSIGGMIALLLTSMHMTLLGVLLAGAGRPLYHAHVSDGLDPLFDQQLGGVLMLGVGGISYLLGGLYLLAGLLRRRDVDPAG